MSNREYPAPDHRDAEISGLREHAAKCQLTFDSLRQDITILRRAVMTLGSQVRGLEVKEDSKNEAARIYLALKYEV